MSALAPAMKSARVSAALSQTDLAKKIGVSRSAVSQIEAGVNNPSMDTINAWMAACGRAIHYTLAPLSSPVGRHPAVLGQVLDHLYRLDPIRVEVLVRVAYLLDRAPMAYSVEIAKALDASAPSNDMDFWNELADQIVAAEAGMAAGDDALNANSGVLAVANLLGIRGLPDLLRRRGTEKPS